jgi:cytochrome c-type biogenesis protein CcmH
MRRLAVLLTLLTALAPAAIAGPAAAAQPKVNFYDFQDEVMCVVCRTSLAVANGPQADSERQTIRNLIAQGRDEQQIKDALVSQYGDRVLALPKDKGFNLAAYLVPIGVVVLMIALLLIALPRWRRSARAKAAQPAGALGPELSDEDARRLDEDLARYDR